MDDAELARHLRSPLDEGPSPRTLARVLLQRQGKVFVPAPAGEATEGGDTESFERTVARLGYRLDAGLLRRVQELPGSEREATTQAMLQDLRALVGADRPHETLTQRVTRAAGEAVQKLTGAEDSPEPATHQVLALSTDPRADLRALAHGWLAGAAPLRPDELADLRAVLGFDRDLELPAEIPVKATMAYALATREPLTAGEAWEAWAEEARARLDTGTDLLRLLAVREGADPMLATRPKFRGLPRRVRRLALAHLDGLDPRMLIEDMRRRPVAFKRLGERLHPFSAARRHPRVGLAFAWLRGTALCQGKPLGDVLLPHHHSYPELSLVGETLRYQGWGSSLERALSEADPAQALELARQRPGELLRRTDHLLRAGVPADLAREALDAAAPKASAAVLATGLGHFPARRHPLARRVFLPQGGTACPWGSEDTRAPLTDPAIAAAVEPITGELLARAASLPRVEVAVLDQELRDLMLPSGEATASAQQVQLPRGSSRPIPDGDALRLFLHWMEPDGQRTDLDLSVAFFDDEWKSRGQCDYTNLSFEGGAASHSGDLTSAPAPQGATEFLDLDIPALRAAGVRHLAAVVFSFNAVPFETLPEAFAGFSAPPEDRAHVFEASAVRQRFDLAGSALVAVPMFVDLERRRLRWVDLHLPSRAGLHSVEGNRRSLSRIGQDAEAMYASGSRTTLWQLAAVHAAARARETMVRDGRGELTVYRRRADEDDLTFYTRLAAGADGDGPGEPPARGARAFAALVRADLPLPADSEVYALHPDDVPATATRRRAADLVGLLEPRA